MAPLEKHARGGLNLFKTVFPPLLWFQSDFDFFRPGLCSFLDFPRLTLFWYVYRAVAGGVDFSRLSLDSWTLKRPL